MLIDGGSETTFMPRPLAVKMGLIRYTLPDLQVKDFKGESCSTTEFVNFTLRLGSIEIQIATYLISSDMCSYLLVLGRD